MSHPDQPPTKVQKVMEIELPRPREFHVLTSKRYLELKQEALEALHEEALKAFPRGPTGPTTWWAHTASAPDKSWRARRSSISPNLEAMGVKPTALEYTRFKALDLVDHLVFQNGSPGAKLLAPLAKRAGPGSDLGRLLLRVERMTKEPIVGCQSCGFCRLPYTAYVCPETCPKGLANGPCGGTRGNLCEFGDWECVHNRKYRLSKAAGRLDELEELLIPTVPESSRDSCSWVNHFKGQSPAAVRI